MRLVKVRAWLYSRPSQLIRQSRFESTLRAIAARVDQPQYGGRWVSAAHQAMNTFASRPGRHVVIFASDPEMETLQPYKRNPYLFRAGPGLVEPPTMTQQNQNSFFQNLDGAAPAKVRGNE